MKPYLQLYYIHFNKSIVKKYSIQHDLTVQSLKHWDNNEWIKIKTVQISSGTPGLPAQWVILTKKEQKLKSKATKLEEFSPTQTNVPSLEPQTGFVVLKRP